MRYGHSQYYLMWFACGTAVTKPCASTAAAVNGGVTAVLAQVAKATLCAHMVLASASYTSPVCGSACSR